MAGLFDLIKEKMKEDKQKADDQAVIQANIQAASQGAIALAKSSGDQSIVDNIHAMLYSENDNGGLKAIPQTKDSSKAILDTVTKGIDMVQQAKQNRQTSMLQEGLQPVTQQTPVDPGTPTSNIGGTDYAAIPGFQSPQMINNQIHMEQNAIQRVVSARGDSSLINIEKQRDAAAQGYNTLTKAEAEGRAPSQAEFYDVLGQLWKSRTGAAPTKDDLSSLKGTTAQSKLNSALQFWTGKPAGANTQDIIGNIKNFIQDTGEQLDRAHDAYMAPHLIKPSGLDDSRWNPIANLGRGLSFKDATDLVTIKSNTGKVKRVSRAQAKEMGAL